LNTKTLEGWTGHPHLSIIANQPGQTFNDKINAVVKAVEKTVGLEQVNVSYEKFLIKERNYFILIQPYSQLTSKSNMLT